MQELVSQCETIAARFFFSLRTCHFARMSRYCSAYCVPKLMPTNVPLAYSSSAHLSYHVVRACKIGQIKERTAVAERATAAGGIGTIRFNVVGLFLR
jgi:hypothetical protein